jgi:nitrogen fixation protein NifU and related proteins
VTAPLYGAVIAEHGKRPHNQGPLDAPHATFEDLNPLCGDRIRMMLRLRDGRIEQARFVGDACLIATAAASLLTEMVRGLPAGQAREVPLSRLLHELQAEIRPSRLACAELPLRALRGALAQSEVVLPASTSTSRGKGGGGNGGSR